MTTLSTKRRGARAALFAAVTMAAAGLGGCSNAGEGAFSGAGMGALDGMAIGATQGHMGQGAAIGAVIGAIGGAIIGDQNARRDGTGSGWCR